MSEELYWVLFSVTTCILLILWLLSCHQLHSHRSGFSEIQNFKRSAMVVFFCSYSTILNTIVYWACLTPQYMHHMHNNLIVTQDILEAFGLIFGILIFRDFHMALADLFYIPISSKPPKWLKRTYDFLAILNVLSVIVFYSLIYAQPNTYHWRCIYFLILFVLIVLQSILIVNTLSNVKKVIYNVYSQRGVNRLSKIKQSIEWLWKVSFGISYLSMFCCILGILISCITLLEPDLHLVLSIRTEMFDAIEHSLIFIWFDSILILWIDPTKYLCCCGCNTNGDNYANYKREILLDFTNKQTVTVIKRNSLNYVGST